MSSSALYLQDPDWRGFWRLTAVFGAHAAVLACLLYYENVISLPPAPSVISVSLLAPSAPEVVPPQPEPPKPVVKKMVEQRKILVAETLAPSTYTAPAPDPVPTPPAPSAPSAPAVAVEPISDPNFTASYLNNPAPIYPQASRRSKEQGIVYVRVLVNTQGLPEKIELGKSSGFDRLDNAALEVVKRYKFIPARQGPLIVSKWVTVPMNFSLISD